MSKEKPNSVVVFVEYYIEFYAEDYLGNIKWHRLSLNYPEFEMAKIRCEDRIKDERCPNRDKPHRIIKREIVETVIEGP